MADHVDIEAVRAKFPALEQDRVFLDNAGGSQTLGAATNAQVSLNTIPRHPSYYTMICEYLNNFNVQLGASYDISRRATQSFNEAHRAGARFVNASSPDEIAFGASATQLLRNLAQALSFQPGDEVIVSAVDHEANISPWIQIAELRRLTIKWWHGKEASASSSPKLTAENLRGLLSSRTRLIALTHCSNILGTIHDVKAIAAAAHTTCPSALVCVDGVSYAPHRPIDVRELGVDYYCFSWYKVFGPHISMLYASQAAQREIMPLGHYFNPAASLTDKIGLAAASYELVAGVAPVVEYMRQEGYAAAKVNEASLQALLLSYLTSRDDVTIYGDRTGDPAARVPTISFTVEGWASREVVEAVESQTNFCFRWGSFYSQRLAHDVLGLDPIDAVVRVSIVHYNSRAEIEGLIEAFKQFVKRRSR
ncbi:aminotransferase class-V [Moelleriella libera RCEF 2490]|uniref:Aminotransferase class-V n=1 Tax=Moelleriella libera RCEF 2490 TaxID=1081109 RepID=A0A168EUD5_9HYPO|nr:aminotransferase class-V [Moelleriella libera RCEF 2490]